MAYLLTKGFNYHKARILEDNTVIYKKMAFTIVAQHANWMLLDLVDGFEKVDWRDRAPVKSVVFEEMFDSSEENNFYESRSESDIHAKFFHDNVWVYSYRMFTVDRRDLPGSGQFNERYPSKWYQCQVKISCDGDLVWKETLCGTNYEFLISKRE